MLLIFDCDGVLVDSELIALETFSDLMGGYGHPMDVAACRDAFMGLHSDDIARGVEARIGRRLTPAEIAGTQKTIMTRLEAELRPVPGVAAALERLDGPRCVASSSDRARVALTLRWTGLERYFGDAIFSGMDVPRGKPAPDLFLHAAQAMGAAPAACVVIEDSTMGVQAGVAAGMRVIGFVGGAHLDAGHAARLRAAGAREICADMAELPGLLGSTAFREADGEGADRRPPASTALHGGAANPNKGEPKG